MLAATKALAKRACPPALWDLAHRAKVIAFPPPKPRTISVEDIDGEIERASSLREIDHAAFIRALNGFRLTYPATLPADPDSLQYRQAQVDLYHRVSGRRRYDSHEDEQTPLTAHNEEFPFPYFTHHCEVVGAQLMALGKMIHALDLPRTGRILEIGSGYGKATIELAQMGFDVTALDVNQTFLDLVARRCKALGRTISTARADMLDYQPSKPFDRVVFSASFHHCSDHIRMARRLDELVAPGGMVVFANEQILDEFPAPWGLNPSGEAIWAIRRYGWMELAFRTDYFLSLLDRCGWNCDIKSSADDPSVRLFLARRK